MTRGGWSGLQMKVKWAKKGGVDSGLLNSIFAAFGDIDRAVAGKK